MFERGGRDRRLADINVEELEVEGGVGVDGHLLVRLDDLLDLDVDEVVERVQVLLDEAAHLRPAASEGRHEQASRAAKPSRALCVHLQKGRQQPPLLLDLLDRSLGSVFAVEQTILSRWGERSAGALSGGVFKGGERRP